MPAIPKNGKSCDEAILMIFCFALFNYENQNYASYELKTFDGKVWTELVRTN